MIRFQKSKRKELTNPQYENNGPASYNIQSDFMQAKHSVHKSQKNSTDLHPNGLTKSMSEQKSDSLPGPGTYDHNLPSLFSSTYYKSQKFGQAERRTDMGGNPNSPGPGAYDSILQNNEFRQTKRNTFGEAKKNVILENSLTPGPGSYDIPHQIGKGPKYVISKSSQSQPSFIRKSDNPGPAAYIISEEQTKPSPFSVKFNSKTEGSDSQRSKFPGPGHYDLPEDSFRKSKISFTQTIRDAFGIPGEGPSAASYNIKSQIAGLPEYHLKQIEYFKNQIKQMKNTIRNSTKRLESTQQKSIQTKGSIKSQKSYFQQQED